jgi:hypothetical protein
MIGPFTSDSTPGGNQSLSRRSSASGPYLLELEVQLQNTLEGRVSYPDCRLYRCEHPTLSKLLLKPRSYFAL